jgi:HAMP domain-containing protein
MRQHNRRTLFIKKDFQLRFILRFVIVATSWAGATVLMFVYLSLKKIGETRFSAAIDTNAAGELLLPVTLGVHLATLAAFAGILAITVRMLWRRLAEPLAKIKSELARIAAGELARPVTLRKSDEFQDLAGEVDGMRRCLREKIVTLKEEGLALSAACSELNRAMLENTAAPAQIEALHAVIKRMQEDVRVFVIKIS